jgi:hypothetical protein
MTAISAHQVLTIFSWFAVTILLVLLLLIARFYQNVSGERTHFWVFSLPVVVFGLAAARYSFVDQLNGDALGDVLWLLGGLLLAGMCIYLYNVMTAGR